MAKKVYDEKIDSKVNWGGDESTGWAPVSGNRVQEFIKETFDSKAGYVGMVEKTGMYVITKDEETYLAYLDTITDNNPKGDQDMLVGEFRAPFEYSASVEILSPADGYAVILEGTTGNVLKFRASTKDSSGAPVGEAYAYTITFRNGGVTQTYNGRVNKDSIVEMNIDKYLSKGSNNISIMVTGQDTGVSSFKSAEIRILEISFIDTFNISNVYNLKDNNSQLTVNYKAKSTGPTTIYWYIDNKLVAQNTYSNLNTESGVQNIALQRGAYTQGVHSLRFYMECQDTTSNDIFRTDIFHRDFFIVTGEDQNEPMIAMSFNMPYDETIIADKKPANVFNAVQYESLNLKFSVYYQGKASTDVDIEVLKPNEFDYEVDSSYITKNDEVYNHELNLQYEGTTTVRIKANETYYNVGPFFVQKSDMNIAPVEENVMLYFDANGRSNQSGVKDVWEYTDSEGKEYKVKFNNFAWTPTNGWNNNKLVIARGSSIDIDFAPFADPARLAAGCTFEFEFNTTNVYNDDAVICNLCDDKGEPGIIITATEAKFIIKKGLYGPDTDTAASTKFKSGENNRITFVITPRGEQDNRGRFVKVYVNGVICGAVVYDYNANLLNDKKIHFEGTEGAEIELASIRFYSSALNNDEILDNYIFFRNDISERIELYKKNNIYDANNVIDIDALKEQIPVMIFKQRMKDDGSGQTEGKIEDIETEYKDKKKTVYFDIEFENIQDPTFNFTVERARVTPQGTSSMKYPKKNFRFYTRKKDSAGNYESKLFDYEGNEVTKRKYAFKPGAAKVDCWCLKADFAESSGTHNTGTARFWNNCLKEAGLLTKAQAKAQAAGYKYDVRTTVDGFPIVLFYQELVNGQLTKPRFIGKYNFNNDKSTEDVFGFTGGDEVDSQEIKYFYIGKERPIRHYDEKKGEWSCTLEENAYTDTPNEDSPLFVSDNEGNWYMLRGKEMFDNPRMECWEMLDSGALIGLFKTVDGFGIGDGDEKVGRYYTKTNDDGTTTEVWEETFESRFPDCGDYYHTNNLKALCDWMVSCIYLKIDENGKAVNMTDAEIVEMSKQDTLTIHNITQRTDIPVSDKQRELMSEYGFENYHNPVILPNTAENRKEKFRVEKYDHFEMEKMAAYYIYLMRFGGVDQVVKNAMLTTEGSDDNEGHPEWPSKWFYINYDNDTILGVKNNGHLVFDPYITRETKEVGGAYAYAGRESTMWNNLEADAEFISLVSTVDEKLHTLNGLSYINAIDMYNNKQAGQWCERVYNMDAQYKYIDSYVSPTVSETSGEADLDYLFDVQGPRSAHRKWWLSKRFNIFDSKFVTGDFLNLAVVLKVQMDNVNEDKNVVLTSGEDIYYAIGGNNGVYYITPNAVLSGDDCLLPIVKGTQIGTPISIYGAPNIEKLDFRNMTQYMNQLELTNLYAPTIGTKLKKLYLGDKDNPVINSVGDLKISGFGNLEKCEVMDFTAMTTMPSISELNKLKNLKEFYAAGTNMTSMQFADGGVIEKVEASSNIETLIFKRLPNMTFDNLGIYGIRNENGKAVKVKNETFGKLFQLTIHECPKMMNNPEFVLNWLKLKKSEGENLGRFTLDMDGVDWTFNTIDDLSILNEVGTTTGNLKMAGKIHINKVLSINEVRKLQNIFGKNCFEDDAQLRITAAAGVYIVGDETIVEGDGVHKYEFIRVNLDKAGEFSVSLRDSSGMPDESYIKFVNNETGCTIEVLENNSDTIQLTLSLQYKLGIEVVNDVMSIAIVNRIYPEKVSIDGPIDLAEWGTYEYTINESSTLGDVNGIMEYEWELTGDATTIENGRPYLEITKRDGNKCTLTLNKYYDGTASLGVKVIRKYDGQVLFTANQTKLGLVIADPSTLLTPTRNPEVYNIFLNAGLVPEGREKIVKDDAMRFTESQLSNLFKGHSEIKSFDEFQYFTGILNISDDMFNGCSGMTSIMLPTGVITIGNYAFNGCSSLKSIKADNVNTIGNSAFNGCSKMTTALFSDKLEKIGSEAFASCKVLTDFKVSNSLNSLSYTTAATPFKDCPNITFTGGNDMFKVHDGSLYHMNDNGSATLIHMGKSSSFSIMLNVPVIYAAAYSMEHRTENDIVVPDNIVFNGQYIFASSTGNSITLTSLISNMLSCDYLFTKTSYKKYNFVSNEVNIPAQCFNSSNITSFNVPEGIKNVGVGAFYGCTSLKNITFPQSLEYIGENAMWLCSNMTEIYFKGATAPRMSDTDLFNVMLNGIYVYPEYYEAFKNGLPSVFGPFTTPWYLFEEGYVRIIKDGQIMFYGSENEEITNITIGNELNPVQMSDGYLKYNNSNTSLRSREVRVNGELVGEVLDRYTTIYLGDNSLLYSGDGIDFSRGLNAQMLANAWPNGNPDNWYYDARFKGLRSKTITNGQTTSLMFSLPSYANKPMDVKYTHLTLTSQSYATFNNSNGVELLSLISGSTVNGEKTANNIISAITSFTTNDGKLNVKYTKKGGIKSGIDGIVIHSMGNVVYSDPEIQTMMLDLDDEPKNYILNVSLNADIEIPNDVVINVTDNKSVEFNKLWNGNMVSFILPKGKEYEVSVSSFITERGKYYKAPQKQVINSSCNITFDFETETGIFVKDNILTFKTSDTDYMIYLNRYNGIWGNEGKDLSGISNENIFEVETDGFSNTKYLLNVDNVNEMFYIAYNTNVFGDKVKGYIPSFIEMSVISENINEINKVLGNYGKSPLFINDCWVSDAYDNENAWTSDGEITNIKNVKYFYVFGKRIML